MESLQEITQFNTGSTIANGMALSENAVASFKASIDGLSLSQAQAALSSTALTDAQKEQVLVSAGLLENTKAITLEEVKQMASSASLSAQKKEEILTTLQGAYVENEWNEEKLEAIIANGGEAGAIAKTILAKKAENVENVKNIAGSKALTASLLQQLKARLALMATNPAVWIAGIVGASIGLLALQEKFNKSLDECTEELSNNNSEFQNAQSTVDSLESELKTCRDRLEELQKLSDEGTISIIEQEEYERLKNTNDELERNLKIEREKSQLSAIQGAESADETLTKRVQSRYIRGSIESYEGAVLEDQVLYVTPKEELEASINEYQRLQTEIDKLNKSYDNGEISVTDYQNQLGDLTDKQTKARTRASEMSDILVECGQAYKNLNESGASLSTTQESNYKSVEEANKKYSDFIGTINGTNEAVQNLETTQQEVAEQATKSFTKSDMISSINELSEGFEELDKIFSSISDKNPFDFKLLDDKNFKETFSGLESYADFVETISSNSDDIDACRASFGELVQEWITSKGVLDNVNESTAQLTISMLENMGVVNAEELVMSSLADKTEALALQEQFYAEYGYEIANASQYRIDSFLNQAGASETARQYLFALVAQEQVFNNQGLDVSGKISALKDLATQYGQTALAAKIAHAEEQAQKSHTSLTASDYANFAEEVNSAMSRVQVNYAGGNKSNKSGGGSSKDAWKEAYEKELAELEHLHEMGLISDEEYYNQRIALNEKYFGEASGKHEKYLDEYRKNEEQIADGLKKLWEDYWNDYKDNLDKVSSYAEKLFQKQIDELEKQKDNSDDSYEKEIESIESVIATLEDKRDKEKEYWQDQIDAIQDEIDALQDANDERERAINLQQKMYNLQRAMAQRSILQFSSEKGFHYTTNDSDIKNAREEVEQAKFDIRIANLQKQKDALEDKLDEITDKYDVQIEKLNYRKETIEKNMDAENKRIQEQINLLEEQKSKWTEVADNIEFAMLEKEMMEKYGSDVTQKILGGDIQFLNDFISQYEHATGVINSLNDATLNDIMNMAGQFGVYAENLGGVAGQIANDVGTVNDSAKSVDLSNVNTNLSDTANASTNASDQLSTVTQKFNELTNEVSNYSIPALDTSNFASSLGIDGNGGVLGDLQSFIDKYKELCESIPKIWNDSLGTLVNGGGQVSGEERNYDALFQPLLEAMTSTKTAIDTKLEEYKTAWTDFNADLGGIIGVGGGTGDTESPITGTEQTGGKQQKSDKKKEGEADTSSIVGTITAGGEAVNQSFEEVWIPGFESFRDNIDRICSEVVACMNEMAKDAIEAAIKTIEAVNAANVATGGTQYEIPDSIRDWGGVTYTTPYSKENSKRGKAYANGTNGLAHDEKNALRSEYGQPELTVYPNGEHEFTNKPTMSDLPKGTVIYDEKDTKEIMNNKGSIFGKVYYNGTIKRPEHSILDNTEEMKAFWLSNQIMQEILQPISNVNKNVEMMASNVSKINNNNRQIVNTIQNVNVNCPGITSQEVAQQIGTELQKTFSGMALNAYQRSNVTR